MPALRNPRHELFCRNLLEGAKRGLSQAAAYEMSGYTTTGNASEAAASRLLSQVKIIQRLAELAAPAARKTGVTVASLLEELDAVRTGALQAEQYGAARGAIDSKARLTGLFVDRVEVGAPGEFAEVKNLTDVAKLLIAEGTGLEAALIVLDELREAMIAVAADAAQDVTRLAPAPGHEVAHALAIFRPDREPRRPR